MVYVALLRGINVGGNNKIDMKDLKSTFLRCGMNSVATYINSGNVVFIDEKNTKSDIASILEKAIAEDFSLQIKVLVVSLEELDKIMQMLPPLWKNDKDMKANVMFLWEEISEDELREKLIINPGIDKVLFANAAILRCVSKENVTKSGISKIIGTPLYKKMTVRNVNTARKMYEMMKDIKADNEEKEDHHDK